MAKYFVNPFAISGNKAPIPDPVQPSGFVSYTEGFGLDYTRDLSTDAQAKAILEANINELFYEVTLAIQEYQQHGIPAWITSADNLGSPFPYNKYALVLYNPGTGTVPWQSLVTNNTATPGSDPTKWALAINIVTSWNGFINPVDITAGSNISITNGVISFTGAAGFVTPTQLQNQTLNFISGINDPNSYTGSISGYVSYQNGQNIELLFTAANTANASFELNALGGKQMVTSVPYYGLYRLEPYEITAGSVHRLTKMSSPDMWYIHNSDNPKCVYGESKLVGSQSDTGPVTNQVDFDTIVADPYGIVSALDQATVVVPGRYRVTMNLGGTQAGSGVTFQLWKNGSSYVSLVKDTNTSFDDTASFSLNCAAGDVLYIAFVLPSASSITISSGFFQVEYLGPSAATPA